MAWDGTTNEGPLPAGVLMMFGATTAPTGWLNCDGSAVSRDTYAALFAVIGTAFGAGDGSTTFNLPDMRNRMPLGLYAGGNMASFIGATEGSAVANRVNDHHHSHSHAGPSHTHGISGVSYPTGVSYASGSAGQATSRGAYDGHNHGGATGAGGTGATTTVDVGIHPVMTLNFIIKT